MKEETKKTSKKATAKRTVSKAATKKPSSTKKTTTKKVKKEEILNETVNLPKEKEIIKVNDPNLVECKYCHQTFEKGYSICPHCHKRQSTSVSLTFFIVFALVFLFGIIVFHFIDNHFNKVTPENFKLTCASVNYESLVRKPIDYKGKHVKVIGKVVKVDGVDLGFGNEMTITIDTNLFENDVEKLVTVEYNDSKYEQGFIVGDMITVYGIYNSINGNVPDINAEIIDLGM